MRTFARQEQIDRTTADCGYLITATVDNVEGILIGAGEYGEFVDVVRDITVYYAPVVFWLSLTIALWAFPSNEWHRTHPFESFIMWLKELLPGMLFIALPFLLAIHRTSGSFRRAGT